MHRSTLLILTIVAIGAAPAAGQDVVHLKNGDRLVGSATDGMLAVSLRTREGEVRIPWSEIDHIDGEAYVRSRYEARAEEVGAEDAPGHFLLALWCRQQGLDKEMKAHLEKVLEIDPDHQAARSALGYEKVADRWVAGDQILSAKGFVRRGNRWILEEEAEYEKLVEARKQALSEKETRARDLIVKAVDESPRVRKYARTTFEALPWESVRKPLYRALGKRDPKIRAFAAEQLGRLGRGEAARPLIRTALLDTVEEVRAAAVGALKELGEPEVLLPLVRAQRSAHASIRMNAAQAIGGLGYISGVEYLVRQLAQNWGPAGRVNIQVIKQISYIRDFDVEIAQASQIGDPIVGVLREGVILDVTVLGVNRKMTVIERRVIRSALSRLSGVDLGDDAVAWAKWWEENKERLLAEGG